MSASTFICCCCCCLPDVVWCMLHGNVVINIISRQVSWWFDGEHTSEFLKMGGEKFSCLYNKANRDLYTGNVCYSVCAVHLTFCCTCAFALEFWPHFIACCKLWNAGEIVCTYWTSTYLVGSHFSAYRIFHGHQDLQHCKKLMIVKLLILLMGQQFESLMSKWQLHSRKLYKLVCWSHQIVYLQPSLQNLVRVLSVSVLTFIAASRDFHLQTNTVLSTVPGVYHAKRNFWVECII